MTRNRKDPKSSERKRPPEKGNLSLFMTAQRVRVDDKRTRYANTCTFGHVVGLAVSNGVVRRRRDNESNQAQWWFLVDEDRGLRGLQEVTVKQIHLLEICHY
jgi:hypothetical protein